MRNITFTNFEPAPYAKGLLVSFTLLCPPLWAQAANNHDADGATLDVITVVGQQTPDMDTKHDVTGLGTITKNNFFLQESQVENIRDLTRYDPGISVNEAGGRGTSRGFAMRGVEKERVAVAVDGLSSAPVLRRDDRSHISSPSRSSASINEVEYENLKLVDIRKGSSSSESGSGALGGAVNMTTKDTADFFSDDDSAFAGRLKASYTSKDRRKLVSAAIAARDNGWEGFAQYTIRNGHEIRAHEDLYKNSYQVQGYFPDGKSHTFSAEDISGAQRRVPNPLDYDSKSFLSKFGYRPNDVHYAGMTLEHTAQHYGLRDMYVRNFHSNDDSESRIFGMTPTDRTVSYTPTRHYFDDHRHTRVGFEYQYRSPDSNGLIDAANVRLDWRTLSIATDVRSLNCAPWPNVDPDCWPQATLSNAGQLGHKTHAKLTEKDLRFDTKLFKSLKTGEIPHQLYLHTGMTGSRYHVADESQRLYVQTLNKQLDLEQDEDSMATNTVSARHFFIGIGDTVRFGEQLQADLSLRYDHHRFKSPPPTAKQIERGFMFDGSSYNNFSWGAGIAYQPFEHWTVAYRAGSGFRVPGVIEQIGLNFNTKVYEKGNLEHLKQGPLKAEKSLNQEIGIEYNTAAVKLSAGYFISRYKDIIDVKATDQSMETYQNSENFSTHGFDFKGSVMPHGFWHRIPDGLELFAHVGLTKIKKKSVLGDDVRFGSTYSFDAIQPLRAIYGIHYHEPNDKWGVSLINTWSEAKNPDELTTESRQGGISSSGGARFANARSKDWWTTDLTGYYNFGKDITVRAGVYNLFNHRYITWESARETAFGHEARVNANHYSVAPGRNYLVNFEIRL